MLKVESDPGYKVISYNAGLGLMLSKNLSFFEPSRIMTVEDSVKIFLYDLGSNETLVMPEYPVSYFSRNEYPAFIYSDSTLLNEVLASKQFKIPERFVTILDKEKEKIRNIKNSYSYYITYFDSVMHTNFASEIRTEEVRSVHSKIIKHKNKSDFHKLCLAYSMVVSKLIIEKRKGAFYSVQVNTGYAPFFIPYIKIESSSVSPYELLGISTLEEPFDNYIMSIILGATPGLSWLNNKDCVMCFISKGDIGDFLK